MLARTATDPGADVVLLEPDLVERQVEALAASSRSRGSTTGGSSSRRCPFPTASLPGEARTAAIARSGSFTGALGADACLAVLLGFPAPSPICRSRAPAISACSSASRRGRSAAATILDREASPAGVGAREDPLRPPPRRGRPVRPDAAAPGRARPPDRGRLPAREDGRVAARPGAAHGGVPGDHGRACTRARQLRLEPAGAEAAQHDRLPPLPPAALPRRPSKLRARAERNAPVAGRRLAGWARVFGPPGVAALLGTLRRVERCLPPPPSFEQYFRDAHGFDLLLITPLIELGSSQADWLRAGKRAGIRTGYPVLSWDNLTNKGLLRDVPDRVFVWNEVQAGEADELHGVPRGRVRVTGAQPFDHWFEWGPSRSREDFCAEVGLRADRPIAVLRLLVGVHRSGRARVRAAVDRRPACPVRRARRGRAARPAAPAVRGPVGGCRARRSPGRRLAGGTARIRPTRQSRRNYFDSIHHSAAMVGINTTAQIEGAIVGRPVHTVLADEFRLTQEGTLHFHYLEDGESGELIVGRTFDEHAAQLEESLRGRDDEGRNERFLRWFVRPLGLDVPASEQLASAVDELGREPAPAAGSRPRAAAAGSVRAAAVRACRRRPRRGAQARDRQAPPPRAPSAASGR